MSFFCRLAACLRNLFQRKRVEQAISDELTEAFDALVEQQIDEGASEAEARRWAAMQLGGVEQLKEQVREVSAGYYIECFLRDVRYGARLLLKNPGFTAVAVATLALGIGANTAVFSAFDALLLQPLPFRSSDQLVRIYSTRDGVPIQGFGFLGGLSPMDGRDFDRANHTFQKIVVYDVWRKNVSFGNSQIEPAQMRVGLMPAAYFETLGIRPIMGRLFSENENEMGRHYVAAINARLWKERFAGSNDVLGQKIFINDEPYTIVAVMPDVVPEWMESSRLGKVEVWTPFAFANVWSENERGGRGFGAIGRLKAGVSVQQAEADLGAIAAGLAATFPIDQGVGVAVRKLADTRAGTLRPILFLLAGAVVLILLIACLNLANLLLARNAVREREMAMRAALGAGRHRLITQLLVEAALLSLIGAAAGLGVAQIVVSVLRSVYSTNLPQLVSIQVDWRVVVFTLGLCLVTSFFFGLAPALKATAVDLIDALKRGSRTGTSSRGTQRARNILVITEMAMALMLILVAGLFVQSIARLERQSLGIQEARLFRAHFYMPPVRYPDPPSITRFADEFATRVRRLPGVLDATVTTIYPPTNGWIQMLDLPNHPVSRIQDVASAQFGVADAHFLKAMGISLLRGRDFADSDTPTTQPVALVSQEFSRRYFPNRDPIGQKVHIGPPKFLKTTAQAITADDIDVTIIGVFNDFRNRGLAESPEPQIIGLYSQQPIVNFGFKDIVVRTASEPRLLVAQIANQLHALDPDMPLAEVQTFDELVQREVGDKRFTTILLSSFAIAGLVLAIVGVYGVVSIVVSQRKQELAVRIALGASPADAITLVLTQALRTAMIGTLLGLTGAWAVHRLVRGFLFQISAVDPLTFVGGAVFLLAVAMAASAIPAARATRVDPAQLLRHE